MYNTIMVTNDASISAHNTAHGESCMRLSILGSGTAIPDAERGSPGLALEAGSNLILLDIGSGSLYRAERAGIRVQDIDHLLITHLHIDHVGDLAPLLFAFRSSEMDRSKRLVVTGPPGINSFVQQLQQIYGDWVAPLGYPLEVNEIHDGILRCGDLKIKVSPVVHGPPSIAYRIEDSTGKAIVYSGDTEFCDSVVECAVNADLLVLECAFPEGRARPGHLTPSLAGRIARESACKRLLLTHFYPACKGHDILGPCARFYSGEILLARDFMELTI